MTETINVLLVDDHPVVRDGYRRLLENQEDIRVVAEAANGEEACELYGSRKVDLVVLDLNMPGIGGHETIRRLRAKDPGARILVFSMHENPIVIDRVMSAGAAGYLSKNSVAEKMVAAVRTIVNDGSLTPRNDSTSPVEQEEAGPLYALTKREFQIFRMLAEGQAVADVAETLSISPKTVGVHQTNIMRKLELRNPAELTLLAIRSGVIEA
jgi:two-component system invasion response regulator UvrY